MELLIDNVLNIGDDEFYRASRYKNALSVILINSDDKKAFDIIDKNIRQIDIVQQLTSNLLVVFLPYATYDESLSFLEKIEKKLDFTYISREFREPKEAFLEQIFLDNEK